MGRAHKWPNVVNLILSIPFVFAGGVSGLCGLIGSCFGIRNFSKKGKEDAEEPAAPPAAQAAAQGSAQAAAQAPARAALQGERTLRDVITDRQAEISFSLADRAENAAVFEREDFLYSGDTLYAILTREGTADTVWVAVYDEQTDSLRLVGQEESERVFGQWKESLQKGKSRLKLDLYDSIVNKSDWKDFLHGATEEEIAVLAVGARYNLDGAAFFVKAGVSVLGTILSVVLGIAMFSSIGMFALFILVGGYLFFNLLASKLIGYSDTYKECTRKLSAGAKASVKALFREHPVVAVLRQLVLSALQIFTFPYQAVLMIIETFIPAARDWTAAHGGERGRVVSIPRGYDIGGLGALGAYYSSISFGDVWEKHIEESERARLANFSRYEYTDPSTGIRKEAYSEDGKTFYSGTDRLRVVGTSADGGQTIDVRR